MQEKRAVLIGVIILVALLFIDGCRGEYSSREIKPAVRVTIVQNNQNGGLANYPDLPLADIPPILSVKEVVEHRSALHGKTITVSGFVIETLLGGESCPSSAGNNVQTLIPGSCAQPRIKVADTLDQSRDLKYDVIILVSEEEEGYSVGQPVEVKGIVFASKVAVYLEKTE
ncbi:hypothetical protein HYS50_02590 [Candidatus Woesearchaeota archaeon]|nr:hypothetical protein [Candidatus Woesearchaeota archaeon]